MRIVSEQSEADLAKHRAVEDLSWPLRSLAANLIRVVRGAGRAYELPSQMVAVLEAIEAYREVVGHYPSDYELSQPINVRYPENWRLRDGYDGALSTMVQGALQMAASELVRQDTQMTAGESEMLKGVQRLERYRESQRQNPPKFRDWADDDI